MIRQVYAYLSGNAALAAALGTPAGDSPSIWYGVAAQDTDTPCLVCNRISDVPDQTSLTSAGHRVQLWQFDIYANHTADAEAVRAALEALVDRPGEVFDLEAAGESWTVLNARIQQTTDGSDFEGDGSEQRLKRLVVEATLTCFKKAGA
jgi:hypothetical protein